MFLGYALREAVESMTQVWVSPSSKHVLALVGLVTLGVTVLSAVAGAL